MTPVLLTGIFIFPVVTLAMVWTNETHHLHYIHASLDATAEFPVKQVEHGPWFIVHTLFFYLMLGAGILLLLLRLRPVDPVFRQQNRMILMGALIPWLVNFTYILGIDTAHNIDFTPFAFLFTALVISFGFMRFNLMDLIPMARHRVLEEMREGLILTDPRGRIIDLNRTMIEILPSDHESLIGRCIQEYFDKPEIYNLLLDKDYEGEVDICWTYKERDCYFEVTCKSLYERQAYFSGRLFILRDVTDYTLAKKKLEAQAGELQELNRLKDRLFSIISHDLRGPLATFGQILSLYQAGNITEKEIKELIPALSNNLGNLNVLLENLLQWSGNQLNGETVNPAEYNLSEDLELYINLFENSLSQKKLKLQRKFNGHHPVYADKDMIQLVIRNLFNNAIKFSHEGGTITLDVTEREAELIFSIADTGVGISTENQERIFRNDGFTTMGTASEKGTGLGLLLSKDFVEKNRGRITVRSSPGKGSVFSFFLPRAPGSKRGPQYRSQSY